MLFFSLFFYKNTSFLFTGDAAPSSFHDIHADVLIAPYAYAATSAGWKVAGQLADQLVLLHLPDPGNDPDALWQAVRNVTQASNAQLHIPRLGQTLIL